MAAQTTPSLCQPGEVVNGGILKASPLNVRFDSTLIAPHIADAERAHLVPVLGEDFYADLVTKKAGRVSNYNTAVGSLVKAYPDAPNAALEALWFNELNALCAWASYYEALPFLVLQSGSNGVFTVNTEFAQSAGASGAKWLQDQAKRRLALKIESLRVYLCKHKANFELYDSSGCPDVDGCPNPPRGEALERYGLEYLASF